LSSSLPLPTTARARHPSRRADELLRMLLERSASSLKKDLASGRNPTSLEQFRLYLELSDFLCHERAASEYAGSGATKRSRARVFQRQRLRVSLAAHPISISSVNAP
jgi:hypothetical protein